MNVYEQKPIAERIRQNSYVGRGIVIGKSAGGTHAVTAYFIMGRSANSRNRVFTLRDGALFTETNLSPTRANGLAAMVKQMRLYALAFQAKSNS